MKANLTALRQERGISRRKLAKTLGFAEQTVYFWEVGKFDPRARSAEALAEFFGMPVEMFNDRAGIIREKKRPRKMQLLFRRMRDRGINAKELCRELYMIPVSFYNRTCGKTDFRLEEITRICEILGWDLLESVFFTEKEKGVQENER